MSTEELQSAESKLAVPAVNEIQKAIRFFRLYPSTHRFARQAVDDTLVKVQAFFEAHGDLDLRVNPECVLLGDEVLLRAAGQSTDLAPLLYPQGIHGLTIQRGLTKAELGDFVELLAASYVEGEDELGLSVDMLTALWQRELEHVQLRVIDQLAAGPSSMAQEDGGTSLGGAAGGSGNSRSRGGSSTPIHLDPTSLEAIRFRIRELVTMLRSDAVESIDLNLWEPRAGEVELEQLLVESEKTARAAGRSADGASATATKRFLASSEGAGRKALIKDMQQSPVTLAMRANRVVDWAASLTQDVSPEEMDRFLAASVLNALEQRDVEQASSMITKLARKANKRLTSAYTERLGSVQTLELLARALGAQDGELGPNTLVDRGLVYLSRLEDFPTITNVCQIYAAQENENVRRILRRFLTARVASANEELVKLSTSDEEHIVKEAIGILAMAGKGTPAFERLREIAQDTTHEVRAGYARQVVGMVTGEADIQKYLEILLGDPDFKRRLAAAKKLQTLGEKASSAFEQLVEVVKRKEFAAKEQEEVNAILGTLVRIGGVRSVSVLQQLSQRKTLIFGRKDTAKLRTISKAWLASIKEQDS